MDNYYSYGIDARRRKIYFTEEVDEDSIARLIMSLDLLKSQNQDPIEIIMNSPGGEQYHMWAAYDAIRASHKHHITCRAIGHIMSAAPLIFAAGDERLAHEHVWFMFHEEQYYLEERHNNAKATIAHYEKLEEQYARAMTKRSTVPSKNYKYWYNMANGSKSGLDLYHTAEEVMEMGIVDGIILPDGKVRRRDGKIEVLKEG
jgi:ATP-dependent protease ClpP protease subunit